MQKPEFVGDSNALDWREDSARHAASPTTYLTDAAQPAIINAMSVDVEDYFQVSAFDDLVKRSSWDSFAGRVEHASHRLLDMFAQYDIKATFFTLGWVADRYPALVRRIADEGHEVASHGWDHRRVTSLTREEFALDVSRSRQVLEAVSGVEVKGYRAPSYSMTQQTFWAHEVLADAGYRYSSSVAPVRHDHYGIPDAPRFAFLSADRRLLEVPVSTLRVGNRNQACGGGGWFRLYPYAVSRWAMRRINRVDGQPVVFYIHPWEIDPEQPRMSGLGRKTRFRHYLNLHRTEQRMVQLCEDFSWGRMDQIYLSARESVIDRLQQLHAIEDVRRAA